MIQYNKVGLCVQTCHIPNLVLEIPLIIYLRKCVNRYSQRLLHVDTFRRELSCICGWGGGWEGERCVGGGGQGD